MQFPRAKAGARRVHCRENRGKATVVTFAKWAVMNHSGCTSDGAIDGKYFCTFGCNYTVKSFVCQR